MLKTARGHDLASSIHQVLQPGDPKAQIEFIHHDGHCLEYDWVEGPNDAGTPEEPCFLTVKPSILVVRKGAIKDYKANQVAVKAKKFDPNHKAVAQEADRGIGLRDVLSYIELKYNGRSAIPRPRQESTGEYLDRLHFTTELEREVRNLT